VVISGAINGDYWEFQADNGNQWLTIGMNGVCVYIYIYIYLSIYIYLYIYVYMYIYIYIYVYL
jgi:hypothetical protein